MPFIPNKIISTGTRVRLLKDVETLAGTFTAGTEMVITNSTAFGYDLVDDYGNNLYECATCWEHITVEQSVLILGTIAL